MRLLRAFLAGPFCLWLALAPAVAMLTINELNGFNVGGAAATPSIVLVGSTGDVSNLTTYTFTDHATGTAGATRTTIVAACGGDNATNFSISSMTVGGSAAAEQADTNNAGSLSQCAIYSIANPSGTTATIAVTFSEAIGDASVTVWAAYGLNSVTATDFAVNFSTDSSSMSADTDIQAGGIAAGICFIDNNGRTGTWTGLTESSDLDVASDMSVTTAETTQVSAQTPLAITCDKINIDDSVVAVAAFR